MSGRDWQAFDAELRARVPELAVELLGKPSFRVDQEWRWGRKGSLSVVVSGDKAGMWFDHEAGEGGGFVDLVGRDLSLSRADANDWIADHIGMAIGHLRVGRRADASVPPANAPHRPPAPPCSDSEAPAPGGGGDRATMRADDAAARAARIWAAARPAPTEHPYLTAKQAVPLALRMDARGHLVVPLQDADGRLHSLETIAPGGAKRGHFAAIGADPAPIVDSTGPLLICEGWATGTSLAMATGHAVIAAMDAGNLLPVAEALRARFPDADLVLVADNDAKPDRDTNPGVEAARKAALAVDARIAIPVIPGDANDLFCVAGSEVVAALVAGAAKIPPPPPTYPAPTLTPDEARTTLAEAIWSCRCRTWAVACTASRPSRRTRGQALSRGRRQARAFLRDRDGPGTDRGSHRADPDLRGLGHGCQPRDGDLPCGHRRDGRRQPAAGCRGAAGPVSRGRHHPCCRQRRKARP